MAFQSAFQRVFDRELCRTAPRQVVRTPLVTGMDRGATYGRRMCQAYSTTRSALTDTTKDFQIIADMLDIRVH